ncbi:MAG: CotH kinase family protein [Aeromicrobium sp.]|uniref:CotH kinase family protein n=1 Tax=Aeromicrobium sp. TaxID=1871063 RepID=UPI003C534782
MRRSLLPYALFLSIVAALLTGTASSAGAASTTYGGGSPYGVFYAKPGDFADGDRVTLAANFPSDQKYRDVTFYQRVGDTDTFESIGVDTSNRNGNAYLTNHLMTGDQTLFARATTGKQTQLFNVSGDSGPRTCARAGTIYTSPKIVTPGSSVTIAGNFLSDQKYLDVTFYRVTGDTEEILGTDKSNRYGNAYLTDVPVDAEIRVRAETSAGRCTKTLTITPEAVDPDSSTDERGRFYTRPGDVREGETAELAANFASPLRNLTVTFFREVSPDTWESVGSDVSNSSGNAYLPGFTFDKPETFFGMTDTGVRTPVETITPATIDTVNGGPDTLGNHILYVVTDDRKIPSRKGVQHPGRAAWSIGGELSETFDLETLSVRGNTTSKQSKKPFKLKFDKSQKPFGLKKDKTWVLLANFNDRSFVRSFAGLDLGARLEGLDWTSKGVFTEVVVNGSYRGSYQLVQSIKIDNDRVDINEDTGQIIEFDPWWREDGVPGMEGKGIYARLDYSWKDPDEYKYEDDGSLRPDGLSKKKIADMKDKIRNFEDVLYGPNVITGSAKKRNWGSYSPSSPAKDWLTYLDLDSAVDYYLLKEFTKDTDSDMYRSNYFYTNNADPGSADKFFMGPVWDFDRSAGARDSSTMPELDNPEGWWLRGTGQAYHNTAKIHWYTQLIKDPRFLDALKARWAAAKDEFYIMAGGGGSGNGGDAVTRGVEAIGGGDYAVGLRVVGNDNQMWASKTDRLKPRVKPYDAEAELAWLRNWYDARYTWFDDNL